MRTKLVFALVAVSLISMVTLGGVTYSQARALLRENTLAQLDGLAETKREGLETVIGGWHDRVALVASRTQLRVNLARLNQGGDRSSVAAIQRILEDAVDSEAAVRTLSVWDANEQPVATAPRGHERVTDDPTQWRGLANTAGTDVVLEGIELTPSGALRARFLAPLVLEEARVGTLAVELDGEALVAFAQNYNGLGETGEVLIVIRDEDGASRIVHQRFGGGGGVPLALASGGDPLESAAREGSVYGEGVTDYRGEPVWVATRPLNLPGWAVIVKFDASEATAPSDQFRANLMNTGLALAAFAILIGTLLGIRFAKPINDLADVANRIREGELGARATIVNQDEIGLFARTFNQMTDALERQVSLLRESETFFEASLDMLCIAGTDGYFKRVNPAFTETLGWTEEELLSRPFSDFVHPDDLAATAAEVEKLSKGIPTVSFENRYRRADGTYVDLSWRTRPEAETGMLYAVARDITHLTRLKTAEAEVDRLKKRLEAKDSAPEDAP